MGTPEFPNLGKHCSVDDCNLLDFLPFTCDQCKQVFCLEHRSYTKHPCSKSSLKDVTVQVCPLCAKGVRMVANEDPNITWDRHVNTDCDPSNYQKATKKRRCPAPGCRETLTFSNTISCRDCTIEHCLKHRFGPDHRCPGQRKPDASIPFKSLSRRSQKDRSRLTRASPQWATSVLNAASDVLASAEAGMARLSVASTQALQKVKDGMAQSNSGMEECPQCQARFSTVKDLTEHAQRVHGDGGGSGPKKVKIDVCPKCGRGFRDAISLVEHVERDHRGTSSCLEGASIHFT